MNALATARWVAIPGFEASYEVSDAGQVRSLLSRRGPLVLKATRSGGYPRVELFGPNGRRRVFVHRLVAEVFIGPAPTPLHQVNHINGDRSDPRVQNLEWVTQSENITHAYRELGRPRASGGGVKGELNCNAKLVPEAVSRILAMRREGMNYAAIGAVFGVHPTTVSQVVRGLSWKHLREAR